jgi:hypothetical protein
MGYTVFFLTSPLYDQNEIEYTVEGNNQLEKGFFSRRRFKEPDSRSMQYNSAFTVLDFLCTGVVITGGLYQYE